MKCTVEIGKEFSINVLFFHSGHRDGSLKEQNGKHENEYENCFCIYIFFNRILLLTKDTITIRKVL